MLHSGPPHRTTQNCVLSRQIDSLHEILHGKRRLAISILRLLYLVARCLCSTPFVCRAVSSKPNSACIGLPLAEIPQWAGDQLLDYFVGRGLRIGNVHLPSCGNLFIVLLRHIALHPALRCVPKGARLEKIERR